MRYDHPTERVGRTVPEAFLDFLDSRFWSLVAIIFALVAIYLLVDYDLTIPRFWRILLFAAVVISPWGYFLGAKIRDWVFDPLVVYVVDLDASKIESALWRMPYDDYLDLEVKQGEIDQVAPSLAFAKNVDIDEMRAQGTWRGTLTDRELLRALHLVDECRGQLEEDAKKGFVFETVGWSIIRNGVKQTTRYVVETFSDGTLPDRGDGLEDAIEDALARYDLEKEFNREAKHLGIEEPGFENGEAKDFSAVFDEEFESTKAGAKNA